MAAADEVGRSPVSVDRAGPGPVLVLAARSDDRGAQAAVAARAVLGGAEDRPGAPRVVATHAGASDLADRLAVADRIYVLDPGRMRALWTRLTSSTSPSALTAPARGADRMALLNRLRGCRGDVRWVTRPDQLLELPGSG